MSISLVKYHSGYIAIVPRNNTFFRIRLRHCFTLADAYNALLQQISSGKADTKGNIVELSKLPPHTINLYNLNCRQDVATLAATYPTM